MKKLPIGIQTFEKLINDDCLYIDKTKLIYQLIQSGSVYFLSRPRRFGKSLLLSTLEAIFKGKKELFKGLWIYDQSYEWKEYPVIRIDFSKTPFTIAEIYVYNRRCDNMLDSGGSGVRKPTLKPVSRNPYKVNQATPIGGRP